MMSAISSAIQPVVQGAIGSVFSGLGLEISPEKVIADMFAAGTKGAWYERTKPSAMYQDSTALNLVAAAGNQVGMGLSRDQGLVWSPEKVVNSNFASGMTSWNLVGGGTANTSSGTAKISAPSNSGGFAQDIAVPVNTPIDVLIKAKKLSGSSAVKVWASASASYAGEVTVTSATLADFYWRLVSTTGTIRIYLQATIGDGVLEVVSASAKWLMGNHQIQATPGARPLYQVGPQRLVFDGVDDVLNTTFPTALGAACTVGRAIPGTGAVITAGQNIGTSFADNMTASALLIVDRALTASETGAWTAYLNQRTSISF